LSSGAMLTYTGCFIIPYRRALTTLFLDVSLFQSSKKILQYIYSNFTIAWFPLQMYSKYILIVNIFYGFTEGTTPFRKVYRNLAKQLLSSLLALPLERSNDSVDFPKRRRRLRRVHILKGYLNWVDRGHVKKNCT